MTTALGVAVAAGVALALTESHAARPVAARAEAAPPAPSSPVRPSSSNPSFSPADILDELDEEEQPLPAGHPDVGNSTSPGPVEETAPLPPGHPAVGGALPALPASPIAPARGGNAHAIGELTTRRPALAGQRVRVRGQVTKVTPDVQGHTFFHLRDGNPQLPGPGTDLVVTTTAEVARGQIATFEGVLRTDVDIGIGYSYAVLLEDATLVAE